MDVIDMGQLIRSRIRPPFGRVQLRDLLSKPSQEGYAWTNGIHIYCELRPVERLQVADSDQSARLFLKTIERYTHTGLVAAALFRIELLELQGTVLHFHKDGPLERRTIMDALKFSFIFTQVLYETMADDLGDDWHGFAVCMDHGNSLIVRHGRYSNCSAISLGPAANRPAKRLLYGRTPAGHAEIPGEWLPRIANAKTQDGWHAINLRDHERLPYGRELEDRQIEDQLRQLIALHRSAPFDAPLTVQANEWVDRSGACPDRPLRTQAFCMRADLDGFSPLVASAFSRGQEAVEMVARAFVKVMEFGDVFEQQHKGSIRLPWAGDCATFLIPPTIDIEAFRGRDWIGPVEQWQSFGADTQEKRRQRWGDMFSNLGWAVGMTYADDGRCLVAPIQANGRKFLTAVGAPLWAALDAQNLGKGGDTIIHSTDYAALYPQVCSLFDKIPETEFWQTAGISLKIARAAAVDAGRSDSPDFAEKAASIQVLPKPRPHLK
jgi:hypothetical protein